jgi:hypothetical protein
MRIANTHQAIYVEDKFLNTLVGSGEFDLNNLNAYGSAEIPASTTVTQSGTGRQSSGMMQASMRGSLVVPLCRTQESRPQ